MTPVLLINMRSEYYLEFHLFPASSSSQRVVTQAYLQSAQKFLRDIFVKPTGEVELGPDAIFKLLEPFYGLRNSIDYWGRTIYEHSRSDLGMKSRAKDGSLFFKVIGTKHSGLCVAYVDDLLQAENEQFENF